MQAVAQAAGVSVFKARQVLHENEVPVRRRGYVLTGNTETSALLEDLLADGPVSAILELFAVDVEAARAALTHRPGRSPVARERRDDLLVALHEQGDLSALHIALLCAVSPASVRRWLLARGVTVRAAGVPCPYEERGKTRAKTERYVVAEPRAGGRRPRTQRGRAMGRSR